MKLHPLPLVTAIAAASTPALADGHKNGVDEEIITTGTYLSSERVNSVKTPTPIIDVDLSPALAPQLR